jgi:hypothetical protein
MMRRAPDAAATSEEGSVHVPARAAHHRVFVDGRVVGEGAGDYRVRCGLHRVRLGSKAKESRIEVPCGGSIDLD